MNIEVGQTYANGIWQITIVARGPEPKWFYYSLARESSGAFVRKDLADTHDIIGMLTRAEFKLITKTNSEPIVLY